MIHMSFNNAATLLHCVPVQHDIEFHGITTDSRQLEPGMLFAALAGESHDGHNHIEQAAKCSWPSVFCSASACFYCCLAIR